MIDTLQNIVLANWHTLPPSDSLPDRNSLLFTKFCQRIVQPHTKILFLVTYHGEPVCILKIMRSTKFNEKLKREKIAQTVAPSSHHLRAPRVFFDGYAGGFYVYAEEVAEGVPISRGYARRMEREIVQFITAFPPYEKATPVSDIVATLTPHIPKDDAALFTHFKRLAASATPSFEWGFTHGDFGRPNLIQSSKGIHIIDWERSGEVPFRFIDAVYFLTRTHSIQDYADWERRAAPQLSAYTGVPYEAARALYSFFVILEVLRKRYPEKYEAVLLELR